MNADVFVINVLNGMSLGAILFLTASGLSLIIGVMGIINLAHGALYMVGAYVGWTLVVQHKLNFWLAALFAGLAAGIVGSLMERGFLRRLHKQPNEQALVTLGFVYILTNLWSWIFGPTPKAAATLSFLSGSFRFAGWSYPQVRLGVVLVAFAVAVGLWWLQNKTQIGAVIRAGMDDREMIMGLGLNIELVSIAVFFFGSFLAGFAGVVGAQLLGVNPQLSMNVLLLALAVIVVGGIGSVGGALFGSMFIGLIDAFGKALFPEFAMFTVYLAMIIVLLVRPTGLLGRKI